MQRVEQRLTDVENRLDGHHVRILDLERDRTLVRELVAQTRELAMQAQQSLRQLDAVAERAVEKVLRRRDEEQEQRAKVARDERREGWRYRLLWAGFAATAAYTLYTLIGPATGRLF